MAYVENITQPLIKTLGHTAGLPIHQLAGHAANLEFWVGEVAHAFEVIDGYPQRFRKMQQSQRRYSEENGRPYGWGSPVRSGTQDHELKELRRQVAEAMVRVLSRCHKHGLIDDAELERLSHKLSLSPENIKREK
ncbi:hypothetical protein EON79_06195 [bacterium]|nr:MAG: hypothetical protein EON79_06195 [bacterium]